MGNHAQQRTHWVNSVAVAAVFLSGAAIAQDRVVEQPPTADLKSFSPAARMEAPPAASLKKRAAPAIAPAARGPGNEVFYDLTVQYTEGTLYNPATGRDDTVRLRSYVGDVSSPSTPFVAPRVDIWPGETFRLTLKNQLPADDPSCPGSDDVNIPHCFNATNMHTHGLWISPTGNSDNVLLRINPEVDFQYEYNIPPDHAAGTFWYHPHLHGSTALQVSSGMAGALIIHGDRLPERRGDGGIATGDVDTLLQTPDGTAFRDRTVLFQQIAYACRDADGRIKTNPQGQWICDPGDVGEIEDYDQFGPGSWPASGRYTSINGKVVPTFTGAVAGAVERWRLIHAGVRDTIKVRFRKATAEPQKLAAFDAVTSDAKAAFVDQNCAGAPLAEMTLAADGLTLAAVGTATDTVLQPGYRVDLLMVFPEPGVYCLIDGETEPSETVNGIASGRELLGYVEVGEGAAGNGAGQEPRTIVEQALIAAAEAHMPADVRNTVVADLRDGLKLSAFIDQPDIAASEVTGTQGLGFRIINAGMGPAARIQFEIGKLGANLATGKLELVGSAPYDPDRVDRTLSLNGVDEWTLTSFFVGHPFHIHVNPFQIVSVRDPQGNDVSGPGDPDVSQYANLKGVWKDTIFVEQDHVITVRSRYRRYIGEFVLHCHILDHEDQGMMENVRVAIPDGSGGVTGKGHH